MNDQNRVDFILNRMFIYTDDVLTKEIGKVEFMNYENV